MHRDTEPTPNPSREGNVQDVDERVPLLAGSGVGRFMETIRFFACIGTMNLWTAR